MRTLSNRLMSGALSAVLLCGGSAVAEGEGSGGSDLRVHEWGTFTTLHWSTGRALGWYQDTRGGVSELPGFVHGYVIAGKSGSWGPATARMETPVLYFYTDERMKVNVSAVYNGGRITEYYPKRWNELELIPPTEGGELDGKLPIDPKKQHNHYYEARAVPDAAFVKAVYPPDKDGNAVADEWEKFVFYRGVGTFDTQLMPRMSTGNVMSVVNHNPKLGMKHVWALQSSADAVRWEKLPAFAPYVWKDKVPPVEVKLGELDARGSREGSIEALVASMVEALIEEGLTKDEAAAMVATWDEQWYGEPGQRVFTIPSQKMIDEVLPLKIEPVPSEVVRVFVHRQEVMSPETLETLELALHPETAAGKARGLIAGEQFGRFVHGAIGAVSDHVAQRTRTEYYMRGLEAIQPPKGLGDLGEEGAALYLSADDVAKGPVSAAEIVQIPGVEPAAGALVADGE